MSEKNEVFKSQAEAFRNGGVSNPRLCKRTIVKEGEKWEI